MSFSAGPPAKDQPLSFWTELQDIGKVVPWVVLLLSIISTGIPAILAWLTQKLVPAVTIWNVFLATAPLAASVAIILTALTRGWVQNVYGFLVFSLITLGLTCGIAGFFGMPVGSAEEWTRAAGAWGKRLPPLPIINSGPTCAIAGALELYWHIYGGKMFFSSLLVGGFLAWSWAGKLLPYLDRRRAERMLLDVDPTERERIRERMNKKESLNIGESLAAIAVLSLIVLFLALYVTHQMATEELQQMWQTTQDGLRYDLKPFAAVEQVPFWTTWATWWLVGSIAVLITSLVLQRLPPSK